MTQHVKKNTDKDKKCMVMELSTSLYIHSQGCGNFKWLVSSKTNNNNFIIKDFSLV